MEEFFRTIGYFLHFKLQSRNWQQFYENEKGAIKKAELLLISGMGDVLESDHPIVAIGSMIPLFCFLRSDMITLRRRAFL